MKLKYACLVMDHDDTVVNSTATVHYPSFVEYAKLYAPRLLKFSLEDYFRYNSSPGVVPFLRDLCGLSPAQMDDEERFWAEYVKDHVPSAYPGIREILTEQKARGGLVCVVSHSFGENIRRDYRENSLPAPDAVYGWECPPEQRKPSPWPLREIMRRFQLPPEQLLVVDDLKPGVDMARAAGVPFAAAGWANDIPEIEAYMRGNCERYFKTVEELRVFLFGKETACCRS